MSPTEDSRRGRRTIKVYASCTRTLSKYNKKPPRCGFALARHCSSCIKEARHPIPCHTTSRLLKSCKYKLEKDIKDKFGALHIDQECAKLTDITPGIRFAPGSVEIPTK